MGKKLVSGGPSLSILSLVGHERQLPCGGHCKEYMVHPDSGFAIHCTDTSQMRQKARHDALGMEIHIGRKAREQILPLVFQDRHSYGKLMGTVGSLRLAHTRLRSLY